MTVARRTLPVNYSIRTIIDSILSDTPSARKYSSSKKQCIYRELRTKVSKKNELYRLLSQRHILSYPIEGAGLFSRVGMLPPELVIVDERFKNMCCMPYWTIYKGTDGGAYKRFDRCPGYGWLPGCPPQSPPVAAVQAILDRADVFIVLQTRLLSERWGVGWKFAVLHRLACEIESALGKGAVLERYGSGPCNACASQHCLHSEPCPSHELKTVSLESMGICVDRVCSDLALLTGDVRWRLTWLKHFGLPQQTPKKWKYVEALAVKLP
jgi:hypothetical protein